LEAQMAELVQYITWLVATHRAVGRLGWLNDYAETSSAALAPAVPRPVPARLTEGIDLEDVAFAYPDTDRPVLSGVDLHLGAGSTVAIVGENGAGKTTLVKLLCRFYEPTRGRILLDGTDLRSFAIDDWRKRLA